MAKALWHDTEDLLRRTRDHRQHQDRERERPVDRALAIPDDEQAEDEDADDDRRHAIQDVEHDAQPARDAWPRVLGHVDRDQHGERDRHEHRHADDQRRADERVRDAALLAEERPRPS